MKKIVVGNWKMNGSLKLCEEFINHLKVSDAVEIVICPSFLHIEKLVSHMTGVHIGAQNCSEFNSGSHTGDISCAMLRELGVKYVIVGHSERNESINLILQKIERCLENHLIPIICIDSTENVRLFKDFEKLSLIAYEPRASIGSGLVASNDDITQTFQDIKSIANFKILYGGSVNSQNIVNLKMIHELNGVLVGGASLKIDEFNLILQNIV